MTADNCIPIWYRGRMSRKSCPNWCNSEAHTRAVGEVVWPTSSLGVELVHESHDPDDQRIAVSHFVDGLRPAIANLTVLEACEVRTALDEAIRAAGQLDGDGAEWSAQAA